MVVYVLLFTLIVEFVIAYVVFYKIIISPACVFSAVFVVATMDLIRNIEYWEVELHWNTYFVISGGILAFLIGAFIVSAYYKKLYKVGIAKLGRNSLETVEIEHWKVYGLTVFNLITFFLVYLNIRRNAQRFGASGSLLSIISVYRKANLTVNENTIALSSYVDFMNIIMLASGLIWLYLLINNYLAIKKINKFAVINLVLILLNYFLTGSRGKMINLILSGIPMFFFLWCCKNGKIREMRGKYIWNIIIIMFVIVFLFRIVANLMGRTITSNTLEHISINLSAPILNLDIYLQEKWIQPSIWGYNTFGYLTNTLGKSFNISKWVHLLDIPFRFRNGHSLGNIYTTFYAFYYDFKYMGVIILSVFMGGISQFFFEICRKEVFRIKKFRYALIIYADLFVTIAFSFCSNKFYERTATISYIKTIVCWWIIIFFFEKIRVKY